MKTLDILDFGTRPLLVPCYLLAARLSAAIVESRRARPRLRPDNDRSNAASHLPLENVPEPAELENYPAISVIVPALNAEKTIERCLESIRALDYPRNRLEVVVGDNGSTDRTPETARQLGARVVVQEKRGPAAARNAAIAAAEGEYVATTDADCIVHPLWLKHLVAAVQRAPGEYSAAGGRIINLCHDAVVREFCELEGVLDQEGAVEGRLLPFPFVITANGLFRRVVLGRVGGFDETFAEAAAEDADLGWRLHKSGFRMAYAPDAVVFHPQRDRDVDIYAQFYRYGRNEVQLYLKHRDRFRPEELSMHVWLRPLLYRHFWEAAWRWAGARRPERRRLWRLVLLKELGHMAGKMAGGRRWKTWRYFRLWTHE